MKNKFLWILLLMIFQIPIKAFAQKHEVKQLLLNVEKLAQFKEILQEMKRGYNILLKGYGTVKDITQGNFSLHQTFLDGLLQVSPVVKNYHGVSELLRLQVQLLQQTKRSYSTYSMSDCLDPQELHYISQVHARLLKESLNSLEQLAVLLAHGSLRMSDAERIKAIDALLEEQQQRQITLSAFDSQSQLIILQRLKEFNDVRTMKRLIR